MTADPASWADLRGRERGRKCFIIGDGPTAERILPAGPARICMNLSPCLHAPDYWIRSEPISYFRRLDLLDKCRVKAAAWRTVRVACLELDGPEPGEIVVNWIEPERDFVPPFAAEDLAAGKMPRHMGDLGCALALAVWLDCAAVELVGVDFGQVAGRWHWYDPPGPQPENPRAGGVYEKFFRHFRGRALPALTARAIPVAFTLPSYAAAPGAGQIQAQP